MLDRASHDFELNKLIKAWKDDVKHDEAGAINNFTRLEKIEKEQKQ